MSNRPPERPTVLPLAYEEPEMDLNYLYHRHQVSLFMADNARSDAARGAHRELAEHYAAQIADAKMRSSILVAE